MARFGDVAADESALGELAGFLGAREMSELLSILVSHTRDALTRLKRESDMTVIREIAHDIKGMAGSAGCNALFRAAAELEHLTRSGDRAAIDDGILELDAIWAGTLDLLMRKFGPELMLDAEPALG
jgi:HPt (histidine-containing phosphotransfer) domain-containing protein